MATNAEILAEAKDALLAILTGRAKSYTVGGRTFSYIDIKDLERLIAEYESKAIADSTTGTDNLGEFEVPA